MKLVRDDFYPDTIRLMDGDVTMGATKEEAAAHLINLVAQAQREKFCIDDNWKELKAPGVMFADIDPVAVLREQVGKETQG